MNRWTFSKSMPLFVSGVLIFGSFLGTPACAEIGDSLPVLRNKYGSAKFLDDNHYIFLKHSFAITVYLVDGTSAMEVFARQNQKDVAGDPPPFTMKDVHAILNDQIPQGLTWMPLESKTGGSFWMRNDNKVIARFTGAEQGNPTLVFMWNPSKP